MNIAVIRFINLAFQIFQFLILVEVIGSWILAARVRLPDWAYMLLQTVHRITAPIMDPIRRLIPSIGGLDLSPIIVLILLDLLRGVIVNALIGRL